MSTTTRLCLDPSDLNLLAGIPIVYQGQEQHYAGSGTPHNREAVWFSGYSTGSELYKWIAKLNKIRSHAIADDAEYLSNMRVIYSDNHNIATRKGQLVGVFTNVGSSSSATVMVPTGFGGGTRLVDVMSCNSHTTEGDGRLTVHLAGGLPAVLYPADRLSGSGICGEQGGTSPTTSTQTATSTSVSEYLARV